jgi:hypothetical protein
MLFYRDGVLAYGSSANGQKLVGSLSVPSLVEMSITANGSVPDNAEPTSATTTPKYLSGATSSAATSTGVNGGPFPAGWNLLDASRASRALQLQQDLANSPSMTTSNGSIDPYERARENIAMGFAGPVVAAGVGTAAYAGAAAFLTGQLATAPDT